MGPSPVFPAGREIVAGRPSFLPILMLSVRRPGPPGIGGKRLRKLGVAQGPAGDLKPGGQGLAHALILAIVVPKSLFGRSIGRHRIARRSKRRGWPPLRGPVTSFGEVGKRRAAADCFISARA